jgi:hypothetical protein
MSRPRAWVFAATAVIVAGAGLVAILRQQAEPPPRAPATSAAAAAPTASAPVPTLAPPTLDPVTAPWAASVLPSPAGTPPDPGQQEAMLAQLKARTRQQSELTNRLLAELDRRQAAHQLPAGVDVQGVRNNLLISQKLQQVSSQIQDLAAQPDGPQRRQALQARLAELQDLQRQVRLDLVPPAAATAGNR